MKNNRNFRTLLVFMGLLAAWMDHTTQS